MKDLKLRSINQKLALCGFAICLLLSFSAAAVAQRAIPDDNLAYPVLIKLNTCDIQGSGFFLDTGSALFLVTARHVLFDESKPDHPLLCKDAELLSYSRDPRETDKNILVLDLEALSKAGNLKRHPTHDVAVINLGTALPHNPDQKIMMIPNPGVQIRAFAPSGVLAAGIQTVKKMQEVLEANEIYVFGFPSSIGLRQIPQIDYLKPLIKRGIVAGKNAQLETIIIDGFIYPGDSGGPVLEVDDEGLFKKKFSIIGVISQFVPLVETRTSQALGYSSMSFNNSGYSVVVPMDKVLELTK